MKQYFYFLLVLCLWVSMPHSASAQQTNIQEVTYSGKQYYKYVVQPKETIYGISHLFGVTEDELIAMNPFLSDGMKIGQTLTIPKRVSSEDLQRLLQEYVKNPALENQKKSDNLQNQAEQAFVTTEDQNDSDTSTITQEDTYFFYTIQNRRETLEDIAEKHQVSIESLRTINPNIPEELKRGSTVLIPKDINTQMVTSSEEETSEDTIVSVDKIQPAQKPCVALFLPLMIDDTTHIPTERFMEFYEGVLLAADTLKNLGVSMDIHIYDIGNTPASIQQVLNENTFDSIHFVIAGANQDQMSYLSQWAKEQQKTLILPFSSRIQETATNPYIYQVNPPHHLTYQSLLKMDTAVFSNKNILIIRTTNEELDERVQLFKDLKTKLNDFHIPYTEVPEYDPEYYQDTLAKHLSLQKENLIIPAPFSLTESNRILSLVNAVANANKSAKVSIWGYSDWIALNKSNLPQLHALNAYIYGNYYADFQREDVRAFQIKYSKTFGKDLLNTFPRYAMMAYDIMVYFSSLYTEKDFQITPLQHHLNFVQSQPNGGFYNQSVYLIHYLPNRKISTSLLSE